MTRVFVVAGLLILAISLWFWWSKVYKDPERTFWAAINNNLVITGATKHITSKDNSSTLDQYQQLSLGANNASKSYITIEQSTGAQKSKVISETIGTPDAEFAKYNVINSTSPKGKKALNFGAVVGLWSKQSVEEAGKSSFAEAVFDAVPFALLSSTQRSDVLTTMQQQKVYTVDYGSIQRRTKDGRQLYDYTVSVSPEQYVKVLKMIDKYMGLKQLEGVDETQYANSQPFQIKVSVDVLARQLANISYVGNDRSEDISAYGARVDLQLPTVTVPPSEIQKRLNKVFTT